MRLRVDIDIDLSTSGTSYDGREQINFSDDLAGHAPDLIDKVHCLFEDLLETMRQINRVQSPAADAD